MNLNSIYYQISLNLRILKNPNMKFIKKLIIFIAILNCKTPTKDVTSITLTNRIILIPTEVKKRFR